MYILIKNQEGENMNLLSQNTDFNALLAAMKADIEAEYEKATGSAINLDEDSGSDYEVGINVEDSAAEGFCLASGYMYGADSNFDWGIFKVKSQKSNTAAKPYIQGEHGKLLTFTPEEIKEKLGIPFDIAALGIEVDDGDTTIRAQSYPKWDYQNGNPPIDLCVNEMQVGSLAMPTPNIPAPVIYLYDEQGQDELDWFACTSFAPRASGDESSHVVFCDMSFSNAFATTDVFVNPRKGIPFVQCSTENQLSDFRKADSHE